MRWLLVLLVISVAALVFVAGAVTRHVLRLRKPGTNEQAGKTETEASELVETIDIK